MRDIKFRAWIHNENNINDGWMDNSVFIWNDDEVWIDGDVCPIDECIKIMQYTGVNDKNDNCIYEGDIVKLSCLVEPEVNKGTYWKKLNFAVSYEGQSFYPQRLNESEIVGNIYENPELLK